ncbi:MAG: PEP-utilizing enzyme, partial [Actinomycetota bacterium]|nr:PEP-utilizing enzyme [Actinomycetota bacterium]
LEQLPQFEGGAESREAIISYLDRYGARCVGEIDVTSPRWSENPAALIPMILANARNFEPGESRRRFDRGRQEAIDLREHILERLSKLPDGNRKALDTEQMIERVRTFIGYREYPKFGMVRRYFEYRKALLGEAGRLVAAGILGQSSDIFYLALTELREVISSGRADRGVIDRRRKEFAAHETLTVPRVLTSDGEAITGTYDRGDLPPDALAGLAVSAGTVEGRARVVHDIAEADLEPGDILVTSFTDPSWTPLFVAIAGLVTEVGGLMTHGAVIAREYGLPAVVGIDGATRLIEDGQLIRVSGDDGYVEILGGSG